LACFLAPATAAIIATGIKKKVPAKYHLDWLMMMFWGGVIMLIIDHILNKEIIFYPPFFTANPFDILIDVIKIGIPMTVAIILTWGIMILFVTKIKIEKIKED
jgi:hypothetical protein